MGQPTQLCGPARGHPAQSAHRPKSLEARVEPAHRLRPRRPQGRCCPRAPPLQPYPCVASSRRQDAFCSLLLARHRITCLAPLLALRRRRWQAAAPHVGAAGPGTPLPQAASAVLRVSSWAKTRPETARRRAPQSKPMLSAVNLFEYAHEDSPPPSISDPTITTMSSALASCSPTSTPTPPATTVPRHRLRSSSPDPHRHGGGFPMSHSPPRRPKSAPLHTFVL
jgi:hypothetical protein